MKLAVVALVVLCAGCKTKQESPPATGGTASAPVATGGTASAPVPTAPAPAGPDVCALGKAAIETATCKAPQDRESLLKAKKSLDGIVDTVAQVGAVGDQTKFQVMCAQLLIAIERDAAKLGCTLSISAEQRADMMKLLDAWYAQRTEVKPTGDAAADAVIAQIAAMRDAACECRDGACLDRVDKQLVAIGTMPASAPQAARDLGSKLLEDAARCANRVRVITDPPK